MKVEDFSNRYSKDIGAIYTLIVRRYGVTEKNFSLALFATAEKYLYKNTAFITDEDVRTFLGQLNAQDLCFALACAQGEDAAWDDFMKEYRPFLQSVSRQLTNNDTAAEDLVALAWTELYGLREAEGKRISKFSAYSGRGSLKGWLRAVLFQLSVDRHRRQGRYVQTEEEKEFERLTPPVLPSVNEQVEERYQKATETALVKALKELEPKMKLMLSYYYYDNLTLKQIGQLFQVHEATASRWLQRAQQDVRQAVEKILRFEYKYNDVQIKECINFAADHSAVDVREMLVEREGPPSERGP